MAMDMLCQCFVTDCAVSGVATVGGLEACRNTIPKDLEVEREEKSEFGKQWESAGAANGNRAGRRGRENAKDKNEQNDTNGLTFTTKEAPTVLSLSTSPMPSVNELRFAHYTASLGYRGRLRCA